MPDSFLLNENLRSRPSQAAPSPTDEAGAVVRFWREAGPGRWFAKDAAFDRRFRARFLATHEAAAAGRLHGWNDSPEGALALVLLLDQFPRNAFRGTKRMYATDEPARDAATAAVRAGHDRRVEDALALFFYLPFGHSEKLVDQTYAVALCTRLGEAVVARAEHHRDVVRRFGRFPHRNAILGRAMRPDEQRYLDEGGYQG